MTAAQTDPAGAPADLTRADTRADCDDPVVAGAVQAFGGPAGWHARTGEPRLMTPLRVLVLLTLLTCAVGWASKAGCRDGSNWQHEYQYTRGCYTDVVALYSSEGLESGQRPYYDQPVEYPVVIGAVMGVTSELTRSFATLLPDTATQRARDRIAAARTPEELSAARAARDGALSDARGRHFYDLTWLLLTACALVVVVTTARLAGSRTWDAALVALAPALALHSTTNWDLVAMALAGLGLLAWARKRPVAAGMLLGLATATKLYPVLFLLPLLMLCVRARRLLPWAVVAAALVGTVVVVTLPGYLTSPSYVERQGAQVRVLDSPLARLQAGRGLSALRPHQTLPHALGAPPEVAVNAVYRFVELNTVRGADWDSLWLQAQRAGLNQDAGLDPGQPPSDLNRGVAVCFGLALVLIALLVLRAARRPRLPQVLLLTMVAFLLTNKVDSPQYVLWLLPLAALARPRWRPFLLWQAAEALVLLSRFAFFIGNDKPGEGVGISWFFAAVLLRDALLLVVCAFVVRDVLRPEHDVVRAGGVDDPAGGVLDGAPDRVSRGA